MRPFEARSRCRRNRAQGLAGAWLAVFVGHEVERIADEMNDAGLNHGLREDGRNRFRKAFKPIRDDDQNILDAPVFDLVHDFEPELGAFGLLDPQAEDFFRAVGYGRSQSLGHQSIFGPKATSLRH